MFIDRIAGRVFGAALATTVALGALATPALAETVRIGAPIPITGPFSSDGVVMQKGIELAVEELNAQGGLLGTELEVLVFDIGDLTPDKLQAAAANLIERNEVDVLINGYGGMGPDIPAFCPQGVPYINNNATSNVVELRDRLDCGNILMGSDVDYNYARLAFAQMLAVGHDFPNQKLATITGPFDWEFNAVEGASDAAEEAGWETVIAEEVPYEITEWGPILSKLRDEDPAIVFLELLDPAGVKTFIDQFLVNPPASSLLYVGYTASVPAFGEIVATGEVDGVMGMTLSAHQPNAKGEAFAEKWRAAYGEEPPFSIAAQIFDEVMMWADAVKAVGSFDDHPAITDHLRTHGYEGITGTFVFNEQQFVDAGDDTLPSHLLQAQDGRMVQLAIGSTTITPFVTPSWLE